MQRWGFLRNHAKWFVRHQNWFLGFLICNFTTFKFPAWTLWRPLVEFMSPISRKWELGKSWNSGHRVPRQGREVPSWILFIATFFAWHGLFSWFEIIEKTLSLSFLTIFQTVIKILYVCNYSKYLQNFWRKQGKWKMCCPLRVCQSPPCGPCEFWLKLTCH